MDSTGLKARAVRSTGLRPGGKMAQKLLRQDQLRIRFDLYLNATELALIKEKAEISHLAISAYIRKAALGHTVKSSPSFLTVQALREISRIGNNINQLAVLAALGKAHQIDQDQLAIVSAELRKIWDHLKEKTTEAQNDCEN